MSEMKVMYEGIEITYNEPKDIWQFELRGRERSAESLAKAKEAINKPVADKASSAFKRTPAYATSGYRWDSSFTVGEVTSIADVSYGTQYVWFVSQSGKRAKVRHDCTCLATPQNSALITSIESLIAECKALDSKGRALYEKLAKIPLPKE